MITSNLTNEEKSVLDLLIQKIKRNQAALNDYQQFEALLSKGGISKSQLFHVLSNEGYYSWDSYMNARNHAVSLEDKRKTEVNIIGGILGLALLALLLGALKDK